MLLNTYFFLIPFYFFSYNYAIAQIPSRFIYIKSVIPSISVDLKYLSKNNFVGEKINGYHFNKAIITKEAALALKNVQQDLNHFGYGLKIFDVSGTQYIVSLYI